MSTSDVLALLQTIFGGVGLLIAVVGATLGVLGYLKVMKSIDDNARERQAAIDASAERAANTIKDLSNRVELMQTKNKYALGALCVALAGMLIWLRIDNWQIRKEWKEVKKDHANE